MDESNYRSKYNGSTYNLSQVARRHGNLPSDALFEMSDYRNRNDHVLYFLKSDYPSSCPHWSGHDARFDNRFYSGSDADHKTAYSFAELDKACMPSSGSSYWLNWSYSDYSTNLLYLRYLDSNQYIEYSKDGSSWSKLGSGWKNCIVVLVGGGGGGGGASTGFLYADQAGGGGGGGGGAAIILLTLADFYEAYRNSTDSNITSRIITIAVGGAGTHGNYKHNGAGTSGTGGGAAILAIGKWNSYSEIATRWDEEEKPWRYHHTTNYCCYGVTGGGGGGEADGTYVYNGSGGNGGRLYRNRTSEWTNIGYVLQSIEGKKGGHGGNNWKYADSHYPQAGSSYSTSDLYSLPFTTETPSMYSANVSTTTIDGTTYNVHRGQGAPIFDYEAAEGGGGGASISSQSLNLSSQPNHSSWYWGYGAGGHGGCTGSRYYYDAGDGTGGVIWLLSLSRVSTGTD